MKPVACWHHGDKKRLEDHLCFHRIDLYGKEEVTEKGTNRLDDWWNSRMRLQKGDRIQIVVKGVVLYTATIDGLPQYYPQGRRPWQTVVPLKDIDNTGLPKAAKCINMQGSHRFDGEKTRYMMTLDC